MNNKFSAAAAGQPGGESDSDSYPNPVLQKIKEVLKSTDPDKWSKAGAALNIETTYPKALETWERVYILDIPTGVLTLRSSTPVQSKFVRGGYLLTPNGHERFTIELRPQGWNPKELIDPYFRGGNRGEKKHETLAEGQYARELFLHVQDRYERHTHSRQEELNGVAANLLEALAYGRKKLVLADWDHTVGENARSVYTGKVDEITIELSKITNEGLDSYHASFSQGVLQIRISATRAVQDLYQMVEEMIRLQQLEALSKILEPLG